MTIQEKQIQAIVDDLKARRDRVEQYPQRVSGVPSEYLVSAVYDHVIRQLNGLMKNG